MPRQQVFMQKKLEHMLNHILSTSDLSECILKFHEDMNETNYNNLKTAVVKHLDDTPLLLSDAKFAGIKAVPVLADIKARITATLGDGTVIYDSHAGAKNTYTDFLEGNVADNHNTRPEFIHAIFSPEGFGHSKRYSSSLKEQTHNSCARVGSVSEPIGCVRLSTLVNSPDA